MNMSRIIQTLHSLCLKTRVFCMHFVPCVDLPTRDNDMNEICCVPCVVNRTLMNIGPVFIVYIEFNIFMTSQIRIISLNKDNLLQREMTSFLFPG